MYDDAYADWRGRTVHRKGAVSACLYRSEDHACQRDRADGREETIVYCLPSVSAYIGADIVAGVCVCGLQEEPGRVLFIDIGTNGEIVLVSNGRI